MQLVGHGMMRKIKKAMDPDNLLNPGKMGLEKGVKTDIYDYFAFKPLVEHPEGLNSYGKAVDDECWRASIADSAASVAPPSA